MDLIEDVEMIWKRRRWPMTQENPKKTSNIVSKISEL